MTALPERLRDALAWVCGDTALGDFSKVCEALPDLAARGLITVVRSDDGRLAYQASDYGRAVNRGVS